MCTTYFSRSDLFSISHTYQIDDSKESLSDHYLQSDKNTQFRLFTHKNDLFFDDEMKNCNFNIFLPSAILFKILSLMDPTSTTSPTKSSSTDPGTLK